MDRLRSDDGSCRAVRAIESDRTARYPEGAR
jgi:hypothetical protein